MRKVVTKEKKVEVFDHEELACDLCGFDEDDSYIFPVKVCVDENACIGTRITRDVCQDCYDDKLASFFDPLIDRLGPGNEELNELNGDRWYG